MRWNEFSHDSSNLSHILKNFLKFLCIIISVINFHFFSKGLNIARARDAVQISAAVDGCQTLARRSCRRYIPDQNPKYFVCWEDAYKECIADYLEKNRTEGISCYELDVEEEVCMTVDYCVLVVYPVIMCE